MDEAQTPANANFSGKAFTRGLGFAGILCLLMAGWMALSAEKVTEQRQKRLATQTVPVEWLADNPAFNHEIYGPPERSEEEVAAENIVYEAPQILESGLIDAPVDGLFESRTDGTHLPLSRSKDALTPFRAYRRPFDVYAAARPLVAIAVVDLGLSSIATESAIRSLPPEISFILSPYADELSFWTEESRARGHEIWMGLPVETARYPDDDPGPHTLLIGAPERENMVKLEWLMSRVDGYIGFVTTHDPAFVQSAVDLRPIVNDIYRRGLGFVDAAKEPSVTPQTMALGMKAPYSTIDVWLDNSGGAQEDIDAALARLEAMSLEKGFAVGVIHPLPGSYQKILEWVKTLPDKGLALAPLSATTGL